MRTVILRRLGQSVVVLFLVSIIVFLTIRLIPGDPAANLAGPDATPELIAQIRASLGLDRPIYVQYLTWLKGLGTGDFGTSLITKLPVTEEILPRAAATATLALTGMAIALILGIVLGIVAAYYRGRWADSLVTALSTLGVSLPSYWVGLILVLIFAVSFGWLPSGGNAGPESIILPAVTLALPQIGMLARLTRGAFIEILGQDYIVTARQKGVTEARLLYRHALPNGAVTILTFAGIQLGHLLAGAVVVEVVFAWPGLGRLAVDSLQTRDLPVVQGVLLVFALAILFVNLAMDLLYAVADPRIRR